MFILTWQRHHKTNNLFNQSFTTNLQTKSFKNYFPLCPLAAIDEHTRN